MRSLISQIKSALADGMQRYELAAKLITRVMATEKLNQKQIAAKIDRSSSWVSRLLQWFEAGCPEDSVFGPEIAARRQAIATSQLAKESGVVLDQYGRLLRDGPYVQESLMFVGQEPGEDVSDERYALLRLLEVQGAAGRFTRMVHGYSLEPKVPRPMLEALERKLTASVAAGKAVLGQVRAALNDDRETVVPMRRAKRA
jgi:hypothetical protein